MTRSSDSGSADVWGEESDNADVGAAELAREQQARNKHHYNVGLPSLSLLRHKPEEHLLDIFKITQLRAVNFGCADRLQGGPGGGQRARAPAWVQHRLVWAVARPVTDTATLDLYMHYKLPRLHLPRL